MSFSSLDDSLAGAQKLDAQDPLASYREQFCFPSTFDKGEALYFAGHSLGLMPKQTRKFITEELRDWEQYGVEGHFTGDYPWMPYHEFVTESFAKLAGAKNSEVVAMNSLTVNLHLMLVSFYRPTKTKFKILIENNTFPSDKYAVDSQARYHGYDPQEAVIELIPRPGEMTVREEDILQQIQTHGDDLALILLGNCNYLSGQCFDMESITKLGHEKEALVGFNLAHGAGNLELELHKWQVDFAVWCSYKYLNSGPGGIAGAFVHQNHLGKKNIPRFEGWWGTNKKTRFDMGPNFDPIDTVEAWQLSNPPIFQLAALRSSMEIFDSVGMSALIKKRDHLTSYLQWLITKGCENFVEIRTPSLCTGKQSRGSMLSLGVKLNGKKLLEKFKEKNVILDFREPDILRVSTTALYNNYSDAWKLVEIIKQVADESS